MLLKFRTDKGRDPQPDSFAEDSQLLLQIRDDVLETMDLSSELLPNTFVRYLQMQKTVCTLHSHSTCFFLTNQGCEKLVGGVHERLVEHDNKSGFRFTRPRLGVSQVDRVQQNETECRRFLKLDYF